MTVTRLPSFLDFEASSLSSGSYPIEVAWSLPDGSIESYLISPLGIDRWNDWSLLAENMHGIPRDDLIVNGKSPEWVCHRMNQQLAALIVYTDNPDCDGMWLSELFSVVKGSRLEFSLGLSDELIFGHVYPNPARRAAAMDTISEMKEKARKGVGGVHRARLDVQYLIELYKIAAKIEE